MKNKSSNDFAVYLSKLRSLIFQFGDSFQTHKIKLLNFFTNHTTLNPELNIQLHQALLAMLAYPADKNILRLAKQCQSNLLRHIEHSNISDNISGSGLFNTITHECNFSYQMVEYLVKIFPGNVFIHESTADSETQIIVLKKLLPSTEYASIHEGELDLNSRLSLFNINKKLTNAEWLLQLIDRSDMDVKTREIVYHQLGIYVKVKISDEKYSISSLSGHSLPVYFHKDPLNKKINPELFLNRKLPKPISLKQKDKIKLIDAAKLTVFHLYSETEPFINANEEDVTLFSLDHGISIALFGSKTEKRYSLESYIGYLAFKNNIPVAYGGGWIFGERCQFGINILEPFRGGESARIFSELLRVYHNYYGAKRFVVKPYQFGLNNPDGLKAGAFWFYYNMGFRPESKSLLELALKEEQKKEGNKSYRSSIATLKKFTKSNVALNISADSFPTYDAIEISKQITAFINKEHGGNREKAIESCFKKMVKSLEVNTKKWEKEDIQYAKNVSLLFCMKPGSEKWIKRNRKFIINYILLKSSKTERPWIKNLQAFDEFWKLLNK